jgi:hypothetical protein
VLLDANLSRTKLVGIHAEEAHLWGAILSEADCRDADFSGARLERAVMVGTNLDGANLSGCWIHGIAAWDIKGTPRNQSGLVIQSPISSTTISVDDLRVGQFIYLLLDNRNFRGIIETVGKKGVLILGRFTEGRKAVIDAVRTRLAALDFLPIVCDFEISDRRDLEETAVLLAGLSRFVIADLSEPRSVPMELQAIVKSFDVPIAAIIQKPEAPFALFLPFQLKHDSVLPLVEYESVEDLTALLEEKLLKPALAKDQELLRKKAAIVIQNQPHQTPG